MAEGMYGAPVGEQAYLDTALKALQVGTQAEHTLGEIAMQPDKARLLRAKAGLAEMEAREEELWQQLAKTAATGAAPQRQPFIGPPGPQAEEEQALWQSTAQRAATADPLGQMDNLAALAAQAGLTTKALKILEGTAEVRQRRAAEASSRSTAALNALKFLEQDAENMDRAFGWVKSPEDKQRADALYEFQTGKPSPLRDIPYDQGIYDGFHQRNLTAKDRVQQAEREAARLGTETHRAARRDQHDRANDTARFRAENEAAHQAWLRKQGDAKAAKPPAGRSTPKHVMDQMQRDAAALIKKDFPNAEAEVNLPDLRAAQSSVAAEAEMLMRRNPALSRTQAVAQAYTQARQGGDFQSEPRTFGANRLTFSGGGKTAETALPAEADKAKRKTGRYYTLPDGRTGIWRGNGWELVQ